MLHLLIKSVKRTWLALLVFALTLALLGLLLNPRPSEIMYFPQEAVHSPCNCLLSPDESLLFLTERDGDFQLLDLKTNRIVLRAPHTNDQYGFDSTGRFVWLEVKPALVGFQEGIVLSLWRFEPISMQKTKLLERVNRTLIIHNEQEHRYRGFCGLHSLGRFREFALLSPDRKSLLMPRYSYSSATFDIIDVETGKVKAPLGLPPIKINATYTSLVEAEFSLNGRSLLIQTENRNGDTIRYDLRLFDVSTGRETAFIQLPGLEKPKHDYMEDSLEGGWNGFNRTSSIASNPSRLGPILHFVNDRVIAERHHGQGKKDLHVVNVKSKTGATKELEGVMPANNEWQIRNDFLTKFDNPSVQCFSDSAKKIVTCCAQFEKSNGPIGLAALPLSAFINFGIYSLEDGRLLASSSHDIPQPEGVHRLDPHKVVALLADTKLLIEEAFHIPNADSKVLNWINKLKDKLSISPTKSFRLIDPATGSCTSCFTIPWATIYSSFLIRNQQVLTLIGSDNDGLFLMRYDYPLGKPWLLIFSWAFALAAISQILYERTRALKCRRMKSYR